MSAPFLCRVTTSKPFPTRLWPGTKGADRHWLEFPIRGQGRTGVRQSSRRAVVVMENMAEPEEETKKWLKLIKTNQI